MRFAKVLVLLFCISLIFSSCAPKKPVNSSNNTTTATSKSTTTSGSAATEATSSVSGSSNSGWMEGIPDIIPEFAYGSCDKTRSVKSETGNVTTYLLYYKGVTKDNINDYSDKLKAKGFEVITYIDTIGLPSSANGELTKDSVKYQVIALLHNDTGEVDFSINITK